MLDKCPNCGEPLVTKTIKKKLATGSIDYPISQTCPKCNWSKDLTGASDIVSKPVTEIPPAAKKEEVKIQLAPPKAEPPKAQPMLGPSTDINKIIIVVLAILVLGGLAWAFFLHPGAPTKQVENPKPTVTATVTQTTVQTPIVTVTTIPEVTPTGNKTLVELDIRRGFVRNGEITIKPGDEIIWTNTGTDTLTLVSSDGLFDAQILAYDKEYRYTFLKSSGIYNFYLKENTNLNGTIVVEP
jgi:plastocyanin